MKENVLGKLFLVVKEAEQAGITGEWVESTREGAYKRACQRCQNEAQLEEVKKAFHKLPVYKSTRGGLVKNGFRVARGCGER